MNIWQTNNITELLNNVFIYFNSQPKEIRIVWFLCLIFLCLWLILILALFLSKSVRNRRTINNQKIKSELEEKILAILFGNSQLNSATSILNISSLTRKKIAVDILVDLKKKLSGDLFNKIDEIYYALKLDKYSIKKAKSRKYHISAKGIQELAIMNCNEVVGIAEQRINSSNQTLREEAIYNLIYLKGFEGLSVLKNVHESISNWQMIRILNTLHQHDIPKDFDLNDYLNLSNDDALVLLIRIITQKGLFNYGKSFIHFKGSPNSKVRKEVAIMIGSFGMINYLDEVLKWLEIEKEIDVQTELIKSLELMLDEQSALKLFKLFVLFTFNVKLEIGKVLYRFKEKLPKYHTELNLILDRTNSNDLLS